jgi:hypothetical protein
MKRTLVIGAAALLLSALPTAASTFLAMSQEELVAESAAVVVGRVLSVQSFWNDEGTAILTEAAVQVEETVVGRSATVVLVRTFGGEVDGLRIEAHGFPTFAKGQRLLLFLRGAEAQAEVVGYRLGEYRVLTRSDGVDVAVPTVDGSVALLNRDGSAAERPRAIVLEALKERIRAAGTAPVDPLPPVR